MKNQGKSFGITSNEVILVLIFSFLFIFRLIKEEKIKYFEVSEVFWVPLAIGFFLYYILVFINKRRRYSVNLENLNLKNLVELIKNPFFSIKMSSLIFMLSGIFSAIYKVIYQNDALFSLFIFNWGFVMFFLFYIFWRKGMGTGSAPDT